MDLLVATTNPGKVREIRRVLAGVPFTVRTLADLGEIPEPEETGQTFAENALLKARYYARAATMPTVAEDSGLAIDALGGRPGVQSARYPGATYPEKYARLYKELAPHARPWTARFVCSLAFVNPGSTGSTGSASGPAGSAGPKPVEPAQPAGPVEPVGPAVTEMKTLFVCEATVEGEIAEEPVGSFGFGYNPIFFYPPYGTTLGNVPDERKLAVAHRGKAFREFRAWLMSHAEVAGGPSD